MVVHVKGRGHAAGEQLEHGKPGQGVDGLGIEPGLAGEDLLKEPIVQGQAVGEGAQENHGVVRVRVLEAGDDEVASEVYLALKGGQVRARWADVAYALALGPELSLNYGAVAGAEHGDDSGVIESYHCITSLQGRPTSSYQIITAKARLSIAKAQGSW